jgi:MFS family permease
MGPQVAGLIIASVVSGGVISKTGRYKAFLLSGLAVATLSTAGLAWAAYTTQIWWLEIFLFSMGLGFGLTLPTMTIAVQNAIPQPQLGQATATLTFLRSMGASFGVSIAGGIMAIHLTHALTRPINGMDARALLRSGVDDILRLPAADKAMVIGAYQEAIATVFVCSAVIAGLAFLVVTRMPELPLRSRDDAAEPLLAEG